MIVSDLRFGSLEKAFLDDFEKSLGYSLPHDYRSFLETSNGGCLSPNALVIPYLPEIVIVDVLFALGVERDFDLRTWREECKYELPENMLAIGADPFGNLFVMDLAKPGIYLWDQIRRFKTSSDAKNAYLLAENFNQFSENLITSGQQIVGPLGKKLLENVWHNAGSGRMQEISRLTYVEFSRLGDFMK